MFFSSTSGRAEKTGQRTRDQIVRQAIAIQRRSDPGWLFEWPELHIAHANLSWDDGLKVLETISPRLHSVLQFTICDLDGVPPLGTAGVGIPLDNLTMHEAIALLDRGWKSAVVVRYWPGLLSAEDSHDHNARAKRTEARAGGERWSYYRSTGWGFIYLGR